MLDRRSVLGGLVGVGVVGAACASPLPVGSPRTTEREAEIPGLTQIREEVGGELRSWWVLVPATVRGPAPLVIAIHGHGGDASVMYRRNDWARTLTDLGWIGVFPDSMAEEDAPDGDVPFLSHALGRVIAGQSVDRSRVYAVGFSGGGKKAYWLAARHSDRIAAIGVNSARIGYRENEDRWAPARNRAARVSVLHIHGRRDPRIPVDGGEPNRGMHPVPYREGLERWATHLGARPVAGDRPPGAPPRVEISRWETGDGHVVLGLLDPDLSHQWAQGYANQVMTDFFRRAPRRG